MNRIHIPQPDQTILHDTKELYSFNYDFDIELLNKIHKQAMDYKGSPVRISNTTGQKIYGDIKCNYLHDEMVQLTEDNVLDLSYILSLFKLFGFNEKLDWVGFWSQKQWTQSNWHTDIIGDVTMPCCLNILVDDYQHGPVLYKRAIVDGVRQNPIPSGETYTTEDYSEFDPSVDDYDAFFYRTAVLNTGLPHRANIEDETRYLIRFCSMTSYDETVERVKGIVN